MKKGLLYSVLAAGMILSACNDDNSLSRSVIDFEFTLPTFESGSASVDVKSGKFTFTNVTTQVETEFDYGQQIILSDGLYNVKFVGLGLMDGSEVSVQGAQTNITVTGGNLNMKLQLYVINNQADFVIMEVFPTGTVTPDNKAYIGDQYFKLYNNSDQTLYADGLFIAESQFLTTTKYEYNPDIMEDYFTAISIFMIPGNGTDYPVAPGDSLIICDNAINHMESNANSFDLTGADFEWYAESTSSSNQDIDNPAVPNLVQVYKSSSTLWILNKQGNKAYTIGRFPEGVTADNYMSEYGYSCNYVMVTGAVSKDFTYYKIPNSWIIDAVNLSPKNTYVWNNTANSLDMGFTYVGVNAATAENYGNAVRRRELLTQPDGRVVLKNTNNSAVDFIPAYRASGLR